jgi:UDP-N-acetylglucosamine 2-epimerase (non-hydrolysing)
MSHTGQASQITVLCVVGARPNLIKMAPIIAALRAAGGFDARLVHTGQHYDSAMSDVFFEELGIQAPDVALGVGSGSHAAQTAAVMTAIEPVIDSAQPDLLLVVGDVNSTLAAALVAAKKGVRVAHVEAGLRSFDRAMPEEINRVLTDQLSDLLFTTEQGALANLTREGIPAERVFFVGNVMIDSLMRSSGRAVPPRQTFEAAGADAAFVARAAADGYALVTVHRPSNVDRPVQLEKLLRCLQQIGERLPVVFPVHPRTRAAIAAARLTGLLAHPSILHLPPSSYLGTLGLMREAKVVLTDSGGLQEETTGLGVPCLTLRDNTERPITTTEGTNTVVGTRPAVILQAVEEVLASGGKVGRIPPLWDGKAALRIAAVLQQQFAA